MKKILFNLLIALMSLGLSACDEDFTGPDYADITGDWILIESDGYRIDPDYADIYTFSRTGRGELSYIDEYDREVILPFTWDADRYTIHIRFRDSRYDTMFIYYDWDGRYMYFSETPDFRRYDVLERYYY